MSSKPPPPVLVGRWKVGAGGFIGEVSVMELPPPEWDVMMLAAAARKGVRLLQVSDFYVHPLRRGRGWGRELMSGVAGWADEQAIDLVLWAQPFGRYTRGRLPLKPLQAFYTRSGFGPAPLNDSLVMVRRCA